MFKKVKLDEMVYYIDVESVNLSDVKCTHFDLTLNSTFVIDTLSGYLRKCKGDIEQVLDSYILGEL